jgi:NO-binding membrane sensor protein with MHYT domain
MSKVAKAIVAALVAGYGVFELAATEASAGGEAVVGNEWIRVVVSLLIAGLGVWAVPNKPDPKP